MAIADLRREYSLSGLRRDDLAADPIVQFRKWFEQATGARKSGRVRAFFIRLYKRLLMVTGAESIDINAMTLATVDSHGCPSARIVLLKGVDARGFMFYTNYDSRKGRELTENPNAALVFYWGEQERQVCIGGTVSRLSTDESAAYFHSRPRGSQIGAWASEQSQPVADRIALEARWQESEKRFHNQEIPIPPNWGGYILKPMRMEFWQGRPNRMHDRFCYTRTSTGWTIDRLYP
jgi:pyridoxamine 5'-phosphate oxidase